MILHKLRYRANEGLIHSAKNKKQKQKKKKKQKKQKQNKTKTKNKKKQKGFDCCATLNLEL